MKQDLITAAVLIATMAFGIWIGHSVTAYRADAREQTAIKNAIAHYEPSPLNCKEDNMIRGIRKLAENGAKMHDYSVWVYWSNGNPEQ
jgi:hypothetical protein